MMQNLQKQFIFLQVAFTSSCYMYYDSFFLKEGPASDQVKVKTFQNLYPEKSRGSGPYM